MEESNVVQDINNVAEFLARPDIKELHGTTPVDCVVFCGSAVLYQAKTLFTALSDNPSLTKSLVLVGGKGHSTALMYDAVSRHPEYQDLCTSIEGLPESRVLEAILHGHYDVGHITSDGCKFLIEEQSTNCGSNAVETRKLLQRHEIPTPETMIVVQDPTMSLRTIASFEKAYENDDIRPQFLACPMFVPKVRWQGGTLAFANPKFVGETWEIKRFLELLVGEVRRLTDDENGYGPKGRGFIANVDVPTDIRDAAARIAEAYGVDR
jgi:hypothetical protein